MQAECNAQEQAIHGSSGITYTNLNPERVSREQFELVQRQVESQSALLADTLVRKVGISASRSRDVTYHQLVISAASEPASVRKFLSDYSAEFMRVRKEIIDLSRNSYGVSLGCDPALNLKKCSSALENLRRAFELSFKTNGESASLKEGLYFVPGDHASSELRFPAQLVRFDSSPEDLLKYLE